MCPIRPDALSACDFQFDVTADGRTLKLLNIIDDFTREALAIDVDRSMDADKVAAVLDRIVAEPAALTDPSTILSNSFTAICFER